MKIELEIGANLRTAIKHIVDGCSYQAEDLGIATDPGTEVAQAFGINFVKLMEKDPKLDSLFVEVKKKPDSKLQRLHRHPMWEQKLNIDSDHVIIDLEVYNQLLDQLGF